ncbi:MAG: coproporphyrinogen dehydrogenase HemZ [Syntrophomonadaceae bacterium]|nr:coproporphyrinogen dehydrogenase HemZ [Syntrophomonadaceae bacterium]
MLICCNLNPSEIYSSVHELIRAAYPGCEITRDESKKADTDVYIRLKNQGGNIILEGKIISDNGTEVTGSRREYTVNSISKEKDNDTRRLIRVFTYRLLAKHLQRDISPYGILTGVRPVKLIHRFLDQGCGHSEIISRLQREYLLKREKAELLWEIAANNRPFLAEPGKAEKKISIYLGIPYCPTRCCYCSFPGAAINNYEADISPFFEALLQEIDAIGDCVSDKGVLVQSIYIGGGTPTVLSETDFKRLFAALYNKSLISTDTAEITVEAGRPDTLSLAKLKVLSEAGVNRVCINPQTMNDSTLKLIGRNHDREGVMRSIEWAREAGIRQINMDLIAGLPNETIRDNEYTAEQVLKLKPDNITIHTLAVKRGSVMARVKKEPDAADQSAEVERGVEFFGSVLRQAGYLPYYLYRQKSMKANMENIGYSLAGNFCIYNIQMIEERQTIIGIGGGAASKFVSPSDWTLTSFYNPRDPEAYCQSISKLIAYKVDKLRALN